jgi:hypothetical protein
MALGGIKMKLDDQVCSIELAKRLKELGVPQESIFYWEYYNEQCYAVKYFPYCIVPDDNNKFKLYSAFTVAELGEMLPGSIKVEERSFFITMDCDKCPYYDDMPLTQEIYSGMDNDGDTEADARAKMLIYLLENGLVKNADSKI